MTTARNYELRDAEEADGEEPAPDSRDGPEEDCEAVGDVKTLEITRQMFEVYMRNVPFASWDDLVAALAERPTKRGYIALHGEGESVIKLDPVRVFGWAAALFLNVCFWGLILVCGQTSFVLALAVDAAGAAALWWTLTTALPSRVAGILWPNLPCMISAAVIISQVGLGDQEGVPESAKHILACVLPSLAGLLHALAAAWWLRALPKDPDRAGLILNLFFGICATFTVLIWRTVSWEFAFWSCWLFIFMEGWLAICIAVRFFFVPGVYGSVETISWTLNLGAFAVFVASALIPFPPPFWLLVEMPIAAVLTLLASVLGRSFPFVLSAFLCCRAAYEISMLFAWAGLLGILLALGLQGGLLIYLALAFPKSGLSTSIVDRSRDFLARLCGVRPSPAFAAAWNEAAGRPSSSPFFRDSAAGAPPRRIELQQSLA